MSNDDIGETSDGYHTFNELYEHRHHLFLALMKAHPNLSWASHAHNDGTMYGGSFIAGMHLPTGDISYHLPDKYWINIIQIPCKRLLRAPEWDGHDSAEVVQRLAAFIKL